MIVTTEPSYDFIQALSKAGFKFPADRPWVELPIITGNNSFCKHVCGCIKENGIEIILKPFSCTEHKKRLIYYVGQCKRCKTIYWVE